MANFVKKALLVAAIGTALASPVVAASGDLLVAPTRIVLDGKRGAEVILNNVGNEEATYRVSLELRRMTPGGQLEDVPVESANANEKVALETIRFAPRRVTLPPNQPQAIRVGLGDISALADGEYRAHMLFRAIPKAPDASAAIEAAGGIKIELIPVYGVTIPVIIRKGELKATAAISNVHVDQNDYGPTLAFDLARSGTKSVFGEVKVTKAGVKQPILDLKGISVYPEVNARAVTLPISADIAAQLKGDITITYSEPAESGGGKIAEVQTQLR